jgi:hypothetical protein
LGIDVNELGDQLARLGSSHPLIGPQPAFGISANVARGVIRIIPVRYMRSTGSPYMEKGRLKAFIKKSLRKGWGVAQSEQKPVNSNDRIANRTLI